MFFKDCTLVFTNSRIQNCNTVGVGKMYLSLSVLKTSAVSGSNYDKCLLVNVFYENFQ